VVNSVSEKDEIHSFGVLEIIVRELVGKHFVEVLRVFDSNVILLFIRKVSEKYVSSI